MKVRADVTAGRREKISRVQADDKVKRGVVLLVIACLYFLKFFFAYGSNFV